MEQMARNILQEQRDTVTHLSDAKYLDNVLIATDIIITALNNRRVIFLAGNGGSASQAQHFAGELVGKFIKERKPLPAISLTADTSVITCIANDYAYDYIFARQLEATGVFVNPKIHHKL